MIGLSAFKCHSDAKGRRHRCALKSHLAQLWAVWCRAAYGAACGGRQLSLLFAWRTDESLRLDGQHKQSRPWPSNSRGKSLYSCRMLSSALFRASLEEARHASKTAFEDENLWQNDELIWEDGAPFCLYQTFLPVSSFSKVLLLPVSSHSEVVARSWGWVTGRWAKPRPAEKASWLM